MNYEKFKELVVDARRNQQTIKFEGIKWQEENHPSAEVFPIELLKVSSDKSSITIRFVTKPHPAP